MLQMGEGQKARLEPHHDDVFLVRWIDPLFREYFTTLLHFDPVGDSIGRLRVRINRDEFTASKEGFAPDPGVVWRPSWPGTEMAVVSGNLSAAAPFVFRFRMPAGYWICPHIHPVAAQIHTISGSFLVGMGTTLDTGRVRVLLPGDAMTLEPGLAHYEGSRGETVIELRGQGPWGIRFVDPRDDPTNPGRRSCGLDQPR
jgi:quercetin dioxygenase-like cupin family protein